MRNATPNALEITPATYARVFEGDPNGQLVLQQLCKLFYRDPYVKGDINDTLVRIGESRVVQHILKQIGRTTETDDDAQE